MAQLLAVNDVVAGINLYKRQPISRTIHYYASHYRISKTVFLLGYRGFRLSTPQMRDPSTTHIGGAQFLLKIACTADNNGGSAGLLF